MKPKKKYQLENPNNARVFIDYKNKKEPVKFEYVQTTNPGVIVYLTLLMAWIKINLVLFVIAALGWVISYGIVNGFSTSSFSQSASEVDWILLWNVIKYPLLVYAYILVTPLIATWVFLNNKKLMRLMPHLNYSLAGSRYYDATFKAEDIKDNKIEIPLFRNIGLDYKATEECSKYLERFEIIEHPFNHYVKAFKKKKKPQCWLWKATFYFSQQPKTGELFVRFK